MTFTGRTAALTALAALLAVAIQLPAIATEPFFVGVNTAVVAVFVGLGLYLISPHDERFTGSCFVVAAGGWLVTNLDIYPGWGSVLSWLVGGALVYTPIGWGILRYGRSRLDVRSRWWVGLCLAGTTGTCVPLMLVSRPEWLLYSPDSTWFDPWPDESVSMAINVFACAGYLAVGGLFASVAIRRLRLAPPVQRTILRPLTLAGAGWAGAAAVVTTVGSLAPWDLSIHANSNIVGLLSVIVGAALAVAINRSRLIALTFVESLPADRSPESLTSYARTALSDPTAELLFTVPGSSILIDGAGRMRDLPDTDQTDRFAQWILGSDGERVAVLVGDPLLDEDHRAVTSLTKVLSFVAENHQLHAVLRTRLAQLTAARAAERFAFDRAREQFRRDLHDGVQQTIVAARMDLDGIVDEMGADRPEPVVDAAEGLERKLLLALDQIRGLKQGSHPPELAFGLSPAVDRTIAELRIDAVRRICDDDLGVLVVPVYFLLREALTNVRKHACGAQVEIAVEHRGGVVDIVVRDDGPGGAATRPGGGLAGLSERVVELGGMFSVDSPRGAGTTVHAVVPVVPA